jgi:2-(1,2-epoxy-1,2-dihydrophenyl)acetyl-CoA isomerase
MMAEKAVLFKKEHEICTLTLSRSGMIMNAFNMAMGDQLQEGLEKAASDEKIRVVVIEGAGGHFSAGADMFLLKEASGAPECLDLLKGLGRLIRTMRELTIPIICKVRGVAYGVGANIALAGDFVVASHDARFCEVFVNIGVILDGGGTYFLPRLVGMARAKELALLGEEISGKKAADLGLIYKSVPDEDLDRETEALAGKLAKKSALAMALIKEGLEGSLDMSLHEVLEWEASHQAIILQTKELKEAVQSFLELRGK